MRRLLITIILVGVVYVLGTLVVKQIQIYTHDASLIMSGANSRELQSIILDYFNTAILHNGQTLDPDTVITTRIEYINTDSRKDIIATIDSPATCGSGGCIATIFLQNDSGAFLPINFAYAVKQIEVENSITNQMHDLIINGNKETPMKWDGEQYTLNIF